MPDRRRVFAPILFPLLGLMLGLLMMTVKLAIIAAVIVGSVGSFAATTSLLADPPSADRGAAMMRAGSAPMPSTPRLPWVRISKSSSLVQSARACRLSPQGLA